MMHHTRWVTSMAGAALALAIGGAGWAQQGSPSQNIQNSAQPSAQNSSSPGQSAQNQNQAPEGFVFFEDRVVYLMANEPQNHFLQAINDLRQNDARKAAAEINIAAAYIDSMSSSEKNQNDEGKRSGQISHNNQASQGAQGSQNMSLSQCADQLQNDAKEVRDGKIKDPQQLSQDFAKANLALADHFQNQADQSLQQKKQVRAGYELYNAADSYRAAMAWSKQTPDQKSIQAVQQVESAASQLLGSSNPQDAVANRPGSSSSSGSSGQSASSAGAQGSQQAAQSAQQASQQLASEIQKLEGQMASGTSSGSQQQGGENASGR